MGLVFVFTNFCFIFRLARFASGTFVACGAVLGREDVLQSSGNVQFGQGDTGLVYGVRQTHIGCVWTECRMGHSFGTACCAAVHERRVERLERGTGEHFRYVQVSWSCWRTRLLFCYFTHFNFFVTVGRT